MKQQWLWVPVSLISSSILCLGTLGVIYSQVLGVGQWLLWLSVLLSGASFAWLRRRVDHEEQERLAAQKALEESREAFAEAQRLWEEEVARREAMLHKRQEELAQKLQTFHEWMEFPQPIDLADEEQPSYIEQDKAVQELIERTAERVFNNVLEKKYDRDGKFDSRLLLDDMIKLTEAVAKIYHPASERPLLETSTEQLLRSVQRTSMQLLILLERLPLDIKSYNLKETYEYVQRGVSAYGYYKAATPYMPYFKPLYYLGRLALGASPVTLGASYALGEIAKLGSKKLATHLSKQYALHLMHDVVAIVGHEAAGIFSGSHRQRDANWIYAAELTELVHLFPTSRDTLTHGLNECSNLLLRSEYDRMFLYQCLAHDKSAKPASYPAQEWLTLEQREVIAGRLEKFFHHSIHGRRETLVAAWKEGVEERLGVKLRIDTGAQAASHESQQREALSSIASFLMEVKGLAPDALEALLRQCQSYKQIEADAAESWLEAIVKAPPMMFGFPDLEPTDEVLVDYIKDLVHLAVSVAPFDIRADLLLQEVAAYYRYEAKELQEALEKGYVETLAGLLPENSPARKVKPAIAAALLQVLEEEQPVLLYDGLSIDLDALDKADQGALAKVVKQMQQRALWLFGTEQRLMLLSIDASRAGLSRDVQCLWQVEVTALPGGATLSEKKGMLASEYLLQGGVWQVEAFEKRGVAPHIRISGKMMSRADTRFGPLKTLLAGEPQ